METATTSTTGNKAFTLLELLMVMSIIAILLGIGISITISLTSRQQFTATVQSFRSLITLASTSARIQHSPSAVKVVPYQNRAYFLRTVETLFFRFEDLAPEADRTSGAYGVTAVLHNVGVTEGVIGMGAEFGTNPELSLKESYISVPPNRLRLPNDGLFLSVWIYPGNFRASKFLKLRNKITGETGLPKWRDFKEQYFSEMRFTIIRRTNCFFLFLTESYALEFGFYNGEYGHFRTRNNVIRPNVWQLVEVTFDGKRLDISVDGISLSVFYVEEGELVPINWVEEEKLNKALPREVPSLEEPLTISDVEFSFYGAMDEVRAGGITLERRFEPSNAVFMNHPLLGPEIGYGPEWVRFGCDGCLDPKYHATEVQFLITNNLFYRAHKPSPPETVKKGGVLSKPPDYEDFAKGTKHQRASPQSKVAVVRVLPSGATLLDIYKWSDVMSAAEEER